MAYRNHQSKKQPKKAAGLAAALRDAEKLLINDGHRVTQSRQRILAMLLKADCAMTRNEVCEALSASSRKVDRVTAYRVLDWLVDQKLAHRIASDSRSWQFNASTQTEQQEHPHFACRACDRIYCLSEPEPSITRQVPKGFHAEESELLIHGQCADCSK